MHGNERGSWTLWGPHHITSCDFSKQWGQAEPHREVVAKIFVPWSRDARVLVFPAVEIWLVCFLRLLAMACLMGIVGRVEFCMDWLS